MCPLTGSGAEDGGLAGGGGQQGHGVAVAELQRVALFHGVVAREQGEPHALGQAGQQRLCTADNRQTDRQTEGQAGRVGSGSGSGARGEHRNIPSLTLLWAGETLMSHRAWQTSNTMNGNPLLSPRQRGYCVELHDPSPTTGKGIFSIFAFPCLWALCAGCPVSHLDVWHLIIHLILIQSKG